MRELDPIMLGEILVSFVWGCGVSGNIKFRPWCSIRSSRDASSTLWNFSSCPF